MTNFTETKGSCIIIVKKGFQTKGSQNGLSSFKIRCAIGFCKWWFIKYKNVNVLRLYYFIKREKFREVFVFSI